MIIPVQIENPESKVPEWIMIELQGEIRPKGRGEDLSGLRLGAIRFKNGVPVMRVGQHEILGKEETLGYPQAVVEKARVRPSETYLLLYEERQAALEEAADPSMAESELGPPPIGADGMVDGYNVVGWIRKKLVFVNNPKPVLSQRYKAPSDAQLAAAQAGAKVKVWGSDGSMPLQAAKSSSKSSSSPSPASKAVAAPGALPRLPSSAASGAGASSGAGDVARPRAGAPDEASIPKMGSLEAAASEGEQVVRPGNKRGRAEGSADQGSSGGRGAGEEKSGGSAGSDRASGQRGRDSSAGQGDAPPKARKKARVAVQ